MRTGTHTHMKEPLTCVGELKALALALETELEPLAAQQLAEVLATIRSSDDDRKWFVGVPVARAATTASSTAAAARAAAAFSSARRSARAS